MNLEQSNRDSEVKHNDMSNVEVMEQWRLTAVEAEAECYTNLTNMEAKANLKEKNINNYMNTKNDKEYYNIEPEMRNNKIETEESSNPENNTLL